MTRKKCQLQEKRAHKREDDPTVVEASPLLAPGMIVTLLAPAPAPVSTGWAGRPASVGTFGRFGSPSGLEPVFWPAKPGSNGWLLPTLLPTSFRGLLRSPSLALLLALSSVLSSVLSSALHSLSSPLTLSLASRAACSPLPWPSTESWLESTCLKLDAEEDSVSIGGMPVGSACCVSAPISCWVLVDDSGGRERGVLDAPPLSVPTPTCRIGWLEEDVGLVELSKWQVCFDKLCSGGRHW